MKLYLEIEKSRNDYRKTLQQRRLELLSKEELLGNSSVKESAESGTVRRELTPQRK